MAYSSERIIFLEQEQLRVRGACSELMLRYVKCNFKNSKAREHATHGFARRLKIMARCIDNVYEKLPPSRANPPALEELTDAEINIQACLFNVFGATDNLAWICVFEKNLTRENGDPPQNSEVGLGAKYKIVRLSFGTSFSAYLNGLDEWFKHVEDYRHALAHRIPLYIPPFTLTRSKQANYDGLEDQKTKAMRDGLIDEYDRLSAEQESLCIFSPMMMHSFSQPAKPVYFHGQMLRDVNTVIDLGRNILIELNF